MSNLLINGRVSGSSIQNRKQFGISSISLFLLLICAIFSSQIFASESRLDKSGSAFTSFTPPVEYTAPTAFKLVGSSFIVPITVDDITGDGIFAFQFVITYNPAVIDPTGPNFGCSTVGTVAGAVGIGATCNITVNGSLNELRVSSFGAFPMNGSGTLLNVSFAADPSAVAGNVSPLTFSSGFFFNGSGLVASIPQNGQITLISPTAAETTVSGRVLDANSNPISRVLVTMSNGNGSLFTSITSPLGNFRIVGVESGQSYVLQARSKRFTFSTRVISVTDELTDIEIFALPE